MNFSEYIKKHKIDMSPDGFDICLAVAEMRYGKGLTQTELSKMIKTKQPSVARVESGECEPSITYLTRVAEATGYKVSLIIKPKKMSKKRRSIIINF